MIHARFRPLPRGPLSPIPADGGRRSITAPGPHMMCACVCLVCYGCAQMSPPYSAPLTRLSAALGTQVLRVVAMMQDQALTPLQRSVLENVIIVKVRARTACTARTPACARARTPPFRFTSPAGPSCAAKACASPANLLFCFLWEPFLGTLLCRCTSATFWRAWPRGVWRAWRTSSGCASCASTKRAR